jgi:hypothetical protein
MEDILRQHGVLARSILQLGDKQIHCAAIGKAQKDTAVVQ